MSNCNTIFQNRIPQYYKPNQFQYPDNSYDKIFASCWIGEDTLAIGTKDNQLNIWNIYQNEMKRIELPNTTASFDRGCGIHDIDVIQQHSNGLLVSGSDSPNELAIFETNTFQPISLLKGHSDWVFGCKFINENALCSGGKDGNLFFWKLSEKKNRDESNMNNQSSFSITVPYGGYYSTNSKIRCISVVKTRQLCYSLNSNGTVGIWDSQTMSPIQYEVLDDCFELITMDVKEQDNYIAVGSRNYTSIIDPRSDSDTLCINHVDMNWGVRKVLFLDNYLIIGGGSGSVSFLDMRNPGHYHHIIYHQCNGLVRNGFLDMNENDIPQAVYSISYNISKSNLFVGGGPLLVGVSGYFGSVWN